MKKRGLLLMILFGAALMIGCGANTAELAFKNGHDTATLSNIIWESENKTWTGPYNTDQTTESKEVSDLNSSVICTWSDVGTGAAYFPETNSNSLSLNPGESYVYTITH